MMSVCLHVPGELKLQDVKNGISKDLPIPYVLFALNKLSLVNWSINRG